MGPTHARQVLVFGLLASLVLAFVPTPTPTDDGDPAGKVVDALTRVGTALPGLVAGVAVEPGRETEAVVLTGADVPSWAAPGDVTAHLPDLGGARCQANREFFGDTPLTPDEGCTSNRYEDPTVSTQDVLHAEGTPIDRLLAYRWDGERFVQIPFQVDEVFPRYLSNNRSGFSFFSNTDEHTSYAFEREGFRWHASHPEDACLAVADSEVAIDPVPGLDTLDELVFMARDAGAQAPSGSEFPAGILDAYEVAVADPYDPTGASFVYLARADEDGPRPAFDASNGYVRYGRDADADVFVFSQSSYSNYGAALHGPYLDEDTGECITDESRWRQRRPKDTATVETPRYRFRYDGRWLMTEIAVSDDPDGDWTYGANLVDRWKARAFQQRPGGTTPCCGYEEEENNWGGSSQLLGELAGPVRVIRETWGADSGTNVVRREVFYRDEIEQTTFLRVHVIPPLDGIYAQWDHAATAVTTYYNPFVPDGVPIDGRNDEVFGNHRLHVGLDGLSIDGDDATMDLVRDLNDGTPLVIGEPNEPSCRPGDPVGDWWDGWRDVCVYNDVDTPDPLFSGVNALLAWEQIAGPHGTLVSRWSADVDDLTPGGVLHAAAAVPYYRDDACFDDGTGGDPGPHLRSRAEDTGEYAVWTDRDGVVRPRECWDADRHATDPAYAADLGTDRFWQGSIGTHGLHLLLIADSDNANATKPLTEIVATNRMVVLEPTLDNVGERYGRRFEKPLVAVTTPFRGAVAGEPGEPTDPEPAVSSLQLDAPDAGVHGDAVEVTATLTTADGPVAGREVLLGIGSSAVTATTGADGRATASLPLVDDAGHTEARAHFDGDDAVAPSAAVQPFTIDHRPTIVEVVDEPRRRGNQTDLAWRLTERDGAPLGGVDLEVRVDGVVVEVVRTGADGIATATVRRPAGERRTEVVARFAGDERLAASEHATVVTWTGNTGGPGGSGGAAGSSASSGAAASDAAATDPSTNDGATVTAGGAHAAPAPFAAELAAGPTGPPLPVGPIGLAVALLALASVALARSHADGRR